MATMIGAYNYTYGAGNEVNRQIQFCRTGDDSNTIEARVFALNPDGSIRCPTSTLPGDQIEVEMGNAMGRMHAAVVGGARNENRCLTGLLPNVQNLVVQQASVNKRHIQVQNGFPAIPGECERVTKLVISALL